MELRIVLLVISLLFVVGCVKQITEIELEPEDPVGKIKWREGKNGSWSNVTIQQYMDDTTNLTYRKYDGGSWHLGPEIWEEGDTVSRYNIRYFSNTSGSWEFTIMINYLYNDTLEVVMQPKVCKQVQNFTYHCDWPGGDPFR